MNTAVRSHWNQVLALKTLPSLKRAVRVTIQTGVQMLKAVAYSHKVFMDNERDRKVYQEAVKLVGEMEAAEKKRRVELCDMRDRAKERRDMFSTLDPVSQIISEQNAEIENKMPGSISTGH